MHPIFLPLNLTEVYAMTVYLERTIPYSDPNAELIRSISDRIKGQLSDYAFDKLFPGEVRKSNNNSYKNDEELAKTREGIQGYLMKSGQPVKFFWNGKEYKGCIVYDSETRSYKAKTEEGLLPAELKDMDFIIESLQYV